jgi:hypothetical protein
MLLLLCASWGSSVFFNPRGYNLCNFTFVPFSLLCQFCKQVVSSTDAPLVYSLVVRF